MSPQSHHSVSFGEVNSAAGVCRKELMPRCKVEEFPQWTRPLLGDISLEREKKLKEDI